jgi:hypothetical protein
VERIATAVAEPGGWRADVQALQGLLAECAEDALLERWGAALAVVEAHWSKQLAGHSPLISPSAATLRWRQRIGRLADRLKTLGWLAGQ